MKKLIVILLIVTTLPACSSRTATENGCRFMQGVYDSKAEEEQKLEARLNSEEAHSFIHVINGLFEILNGNLSKDDECSSNNINEPQFEYKPLN